MSIIQALFAHADFAWHHVVSAYLQWHKQARTLFRISVKSKHVQTLCTVFVAILLVLFFYWMSTPFRPSDERLRQIANEFSFTRYEMPELGTGIEKSVRNVHPSLSHMAPWISFVGAAISIGDIDGDGIENDVVYVDPRFDQIVVCPVPTSGERFRPFELSQDELEFEPETTAPMGTLLGDFNEDGKTDILAYFWGRSPILYLQQKSPAEGQLSISKFAARELVAPHEVWHTSAVNQADINGDGHIDLVFGNYNPDGARTLDANDVTVRETMMGSWGRATNGGETGSLFGKGIKGKGLNHPTYSDESDAVPVEIAKGWTLAIGLADLDDDLLPEIYFAHDFGADALLHNLSTPERVQFEVVKGRRGFTTPRSFNLGTDSFNGMGVDFSDINNDSKLDFIVSNITSDYGIHQSNLVFVRNNDVEGFENGIAPFKCVSEAIGLARSGWGWDTKFGDFNNDGNCEVVQATGFLKGDINRWPEFQELGLANEELAKFPISYPQLNEHSDVAGNENNVFFVKHDGKYFNVAEFLGGGFTTPRLSRGIATADFDLDGDLDLLIANQWEKSLLFKNETQNANLSCQLNIRIALSDGIKAPMISATWPIDVPTMPAFGAKIEIEYGGVSTVAKVDGGDGHSGQRSPSVFLGLGQTKKLDRISVNWRNHSGKVMKTVFENVSSGRNIIVLPGK